MKIHCVFPEFGANLCVFAIKANWYGINCYRLSERERKAMKLLRSTQANNKCQSSSHPGAAPWPCPAHDVTGQGRGWRDEGILNLSGLWEAAGARSTLNNSRLPGQRELKLSA